MAYEWAVPGAKCVCIDDASTAGRSWFGEGPCRGTTYTISAIFIGLSGRVNLEFEELRRSFASAVVGRRCGFWVGRFRPVVTRTIDQDIEAFRHHLTGAPAPEDV